jgi:PAS domain S-box-containing protein
VSKVVQLATATKTAPQTASASLARRSWPKFGVRARQIALITLLVALVVAGSTVANIANMTGVIINRTEEEASQLSNQIRYAIQQELAHNSTVDRLDPYAAIASEHSGVRALMESSVITSRPVAYIYITNSSGETIFDRERRNELAVNRHMIARAPYDMSQLARDSAYIQIARVFFGPSIYEHREPITIDETLAGQLHIGISSSVIARELRSLVLINLFIGLLAIIAAAIVAISSANLLLKPLQAISTSIDRLGSGEHQEAISDEHLLDDMVSGVTERLRQLGQRLAGERSELEIMRGRLRQVISHLEERLLMINRDGRVILASPDAEKLLGVDGYQITGLPIDEVLGRDHPLVRLVERTFLERHSMPRTVLNAPGERTHQLLCSIQYIEDAGEPVGALISLRDFESFRKLESQWDLSKKLADLGRITSGIAHEVKNPLNAMVIHLEILRSKLESGNADPTPQLEILDSEIKRLDRVVQTFLDFTRPVEVRLEPLDLNTIVSQVIALASTEAQKQGVTITKELSPEPLIVKADSDLLTQALLNVIRNGCQAMPNGGPLEVITSRTAGGTARIRISDRGVGIPPEARDRIFNLFYTTKSGGSGIGLAQAFRAVQLHGGQIQFKSQVGVGTTFEITIPTSS